jgi:hypothetical protein
MQPQNSYGVLPKIEVSFQDDFSGSEREITLTPKYILSQLTKKGLQPKIGDKILLWEKDVDEENGMDYLCNVGKIIEVNKEMIKKYYNLDISLDKMTFLATVPIIIKADNNLIFRSKNI